MGLLDQVIGGVVGQVLGGGRGGSAMSPIVKALLMLLLAKGASGGVGNIFGGGHAPEPQGGGYEPHGRGHAPSPQEYDGPQGDDGDLGGFGQRPQGGPSRGGAQGGGDFSDLSGMLDGPSGSDGGGRSPGAGPYAHLDHEQGDAGQGGAGGGLGGGLDGLINSFERGGLGDVIGSWIGHGQNRAIEPNRLAEALGPDTVETLSRQTGLDRSDLLSQLAQALPSVVDALTPQGRKPGADEQRHW